MNIRTIYLLIIYDFLQNKSNFILVINISVQFDLI